MSNRVFLDDIREWDGREVLSVVGPTGSGKTARVLNHVRTCFAGNFKIPLLISVDSVAVYQDLNIGSAKPLADEREAFDWRGLDMVPVTASMTAVEFVKKIEPIVLDALASDRPVILLGGSHFYERALVEGPGVGQASDPEYQADLARLAPEELWGRLMTLDMRWSQKVHPNDRYRLTRFLDLAERQGLSWEELFSAPKVSSQRSRLWPHTATLVLGLDTAVDIHKRILRERIGSMMAQGWFSEVREILENGVRPSAPGLQTVGYREIVACLKGELDAAELEDKILTSHLQLAKKQRTWLRGMLNKKHEVLN